MPIRGRHGLRLAAMLCALLALAACGKKEAPATASTGAPATTATPAKSPEGAVSPQVAALGVDELRNKARIAYQESRLYAPPGDNALEYYLALRDKLPGDPGASSALTDLLPMTVIAIEQSRDREDFAEAQRLYGLLDKADKSHPALPRLKASIAAAEEAVAKRAEQQKLSGEQEQVRREQLEKERAAQQVQQQQVAAQELAAQQAAAAQQAVTEQREADERAAAQRAADERAAAQRAAQEKAAQQAAAKPAAPPPAAAPSVSDLRAISTPAPNYPAEALRAAQSGEVQVEFTVGTNGAVTGARVVRSNPPRVFDREAVAAVKRWRFEPIAAPVTTRRTIGFNPGN